MHKEQQKSAKQVEMVSSVGESRNGRGTKVSKSLNIVRMNTSIAEDLMKKFQEYKSQKKLLNKKL